MTSRVVPEDVFFKSVLKSRSTTYEIKKLFSKDIILNVIDKRENNYHEDVSCDKFLEIIPKYED